MIFNDDCLEVLKAIPSDSLDSMVTDPPAGIAFMGKSWDSNKGGRDAWIAWMQDVMTECLRVLKPGAHALVWALPRTSHWTALACERAGFEVRDCVTHIFGSGFPKSLDVSKAIDKMAGAEREVVGTDESRAKRLVNQSGEYTTDTGWSAGNRCSDITAPATPEAREWQGYGTALKPSSEHWWLLRKPLGEKTVAKNVLKHGCGALNIDASRIGGEPWKAHSSTGLAKTKFFTDGETPVVDKEPHSQGRFPSNTLFSHHPECEIVGMRKVKVGGGRPPQERYGKETVPDYRCHDECAVAELDRQSGVSKSTGGRTVKRSGKYEDGKVSAPGIWTNENPGLGDVGGASRFFATFQYCAKASRKDKGEGNVHPTVKSTKLMTYLITMVTPTGGIVLDPFMGSGSTGVAALKAGFGFMGIEREAEYFEIASARLEAVEV